MPVMLEPNHGATSNQTMNHPLSTKRLHIIGRKNSGKTTLMVDLIRELTRRGFRVGSIKHTHHHHELDTPGKDSHRHREAGSSAVGIVSPQMNAIFWPRDPSIDKGSNKYQQFDSLLHECDVVLVEGDASASAPRIEVFRAASREEPIALTDQSILAVVSDDPLNLHVPVWARSNPEFIADQIESLLQLT
jgi:molybdopterin-guanine dinucleotide biosynthesis adapter protein